MTKASIESGVNPQTQATAFCLGDDRLADSKRLEFAFLKEDTELERSLAAHQGVGFGWGLSSSPIGILPLDGASLILSLHRLMATSTLGLKAVDRKIRIDSQFMTPAVNQHETRVRFAASALLGFRRSDSILRHFVVYKYSIVLYCIFEINTTSIFPSRAKAK